MRAVEVPCESCKAPAGVICCYDPGRRRMFCKARTTSARRITGSENNKRVRSKKSRRAVGRIPVPDISIQLALVGHGYQVDVFDTGKHLGSSCRDFDGSYKLNQLKASFIEMFGKALRQWRDSL